ncbi:MAG TPA: AbrB/MazE/SpoVT family DNA-binding domain-containing protein [Rhizomicrobium sp.]|nr:AbrB/MazE/SpoVT family DNA-binding domain-containing protein [Rhizomicrobium sp.]
MKVAKWGNSLAVRLPTAVVDMLELKDGDQVEITIAGKRNLEVERKMTREEALAVMRSLRRPLPPGYKFDRQEANER